MFVDVCLWEQSFTLFSVVIVIGCVMFVDVCLWEQSFTLFSVVFWSECLLSLTPLRLL